MSTRETVISFESKNISFMAKTGLVVWLTGLPCSGKTTTAKVLEGKLLSRGLRVHLLDGDELRKSISSDLGYSKRDREQQVKRVAQISLVNSAKGIITIVALVSPYRSFRLYARSLIGNFVEVWVNCSLQTCRKRDLKGLYKRAIQGKITNLTGIQDPYEHPLNPEVIINTENETPDECADKILKYLDGT